MKKFIFFRDDDVFKKDEAFVDLFNLFLNRKIPITYGVIPEKVQSDLVNFLNISKNKYPKLFDIAQHGWMHKNHNPIDSESKFEFGKGRSYKEQKKDITNGWSLMKQQFGKNFSLIFIPPFHGYDFNTLKIINELGEKGNLQVFSSGNKTVPKEKKFLDLPTLFNITPKTLGSKSNIRAFIKQLHTKHINSSINGILLHHKDFKNNHLDSLIRLVKILENDKSFSFLLLSDIKKHTHMNKINVTISITNRCNLKCKICNIWQEKPKLDITDEPIKKLFSKLFKSYKIGSVSITGGEPFANRHIIDIYKSLEKFKENRLIDSIGIYTNGYNDKVTFNFLNNHYNKNIKLDLGISLDGIGNTHNKIRGVSDSFNKTSRLINYIKNNFPQICLAAKFTITPFNFKQILKVYEFCSIRNIFFTPKLVEYNNQFYYHKLPRKNHFPLSFNKPQKMIIIGSLKKIIKKEKNKKNPIVELNMLKTIISCLKNDKLQHPCYTPLYSLFINHEGNIYPCFYTQPIGNIFKNGWINHIMDNKHLEIIQDGINNRCRGCFSYHGFLKNENIKSS